jgi:CelD/BcsL family acetyltransferase involved in cellulose biosynthesis
MSGWRVIPLPKGLGQYAAAWDALNRERFGNHPLLSSMFMERLLRTFGTGREYLCILGEDQAVRAMLILRQRSRFVWTSFLPAQCQLGPTMVPAAALLDTLIPSLPGKVLQVDLLCNDPQLNDVLDNTSQSARRMAHALTMSIALEGSFDDYWHARPRHLAANLRRYERRVQQDGMATRLVKISSEGQLEAALARYARLEGEGWKGRNGTALGSTREQYDFYRDLVRAASLRGCAVVYELWIGDRLAASRLALVQDSTLVMLKTSYDEELARYAPGRLLLRAVIEDAFASFPGGRIEFYTDATIDQLEWAGASRWIEHLSLFRNRAADVGNLALKAWLGPRRLLARRREDAPRDRHPDTTLEVHTRLEELPPDTAAFLEAAETRNIGFGLDWYRNLVRTVFADHADLRIYVLRRGGKPTAVLPLRLERERLGWSAHALGNYYTTLYEPVLAPNAKAAELLPLIERLRRDRSSLGSLMLAPMARGSHAYVVLLEALALARWLPFEFFAFGNWYQPVRGSWADYLADRKSNLRSTIKRMSKKLAAEGGTLEVVTRPEDIPEGIAAYEKVYAASWKKPEPFKDFMPGLLQSCAEKGMLRLGLARLNGEPIAAQAWIVAHGRAEIYKVAYDEKFKEFSPGTLVTALLMQHVMEVDGVHEVDYLIGDDPYKKTWMDERRERWGIVAYNLRSLPGLIGAAREVIGRMTKRVRQRWQRRAQAAGSATLASKTETPAT